MVFGAATDGFAPPPTAHIPSLPTKGAKDLACSAFPAGRCCLCSSESLRTAILVCVFLCCRFLLVAVELCDRPALSQCWVSEAGHSKPVK